MGASNALAAYRLYGGHVPDNSLVVLVYMALVTLDKDTEPSWWEGHQMLAIRCFAYPEPISGAGHRAVERAITPLFRAGAITVTRPASGRRLKAVTVRYRLWLDCPAPDEKRRARHRQHPTQTVGRQGQRPTKSVPTPDAKRRTEETGGGTNTGARYLNGPDLTGTGGIGAVPSGQNRRRQGELNPWPDSVGHPDGVDDDSLDPSNPWASIRMSGPL